MPPQLLIPRPNQNAVANLPKGRNGLLITFWLMTSASSSSKATSLRSRASFSVSGAPCNSRGGGTEENSNGGRTLGTLLPSSFPRAPVYLTWARWGSQLLLDQLFQPLGHQGIEVWSSWAWGEKSPRSVSTASGSYGFSPPNHLARQQ